MLYWVEFKKSAVVYSSAPQLFIHCGGRVATCCVTESAEKQARNNNAKHARRPGAYLNKMQIEMSVKLKPQEGAQLRFIPKPPPPPRGDRAGLSDDLPSCSAGKCGPGRALWAYPWPDLTSDDPKQMTGHYCGLQRSLFAILEVYQRGGASSRCVYWCLCDNTAQECGLSVLGIRSLLFHRRCFFVRDSRWPTVQREDGLEEGATSAPLGAIIAESCGTRSNGCSGKSAGLER